MTIYDFDKTIYDGDSTVDFFLFLLRKKPSLVRFLPLTIKLSLLFRLRMITREDLLRAGERALRVLLRKFDDIDSLVAEFWDKNERKIKDFYRAQQREDDLILSGSCEILLREICRRLNIRHFIGSRIDFEDGRIEFLCYHENKVHALHEHYPNAEVHAFYTDSLLDLPMMQQAENVFMVKKNRVRPWDMSKVS